MKISKILDLNGEVAPHMKLIRLDNSKARYFALALAICAVVILTSFKTDSMQSIGWLISGFSCCLWAYWGWLDRAKEGYARFIMESFYFSMAFWGFINWY
jgi:hypothetical protein|tara:strand:- start:238 stop:537 length:300 start_codon:yes stop_codon:yes gene_type:complete